MAGKQWWHKLVQSLYGVDPSAPQRKMFSREDPLHGTLSRSEYNANPKNPLFGYDEHDPMAFDITVPERYDAYNAGYDFPEGAATVSNFTNMPRTLGDENTWLQNQSRSSEFPKRPVPKVGLGMVDQLANRSLNRLAMNAVNIGERFGVPKKVIQNARTQIRNTAREDLQVFPGKKEKKVLYRYSPYEDNKMLAEQAEAASRFFDPVSDAGKAAREEADFRRQLSANYDPNNQYKNYRRNAKRAVKVGLITSPFFTSTEKSMKKSLSTNTIKTKKVVNTKPKNNLKNTNKYFR